MHRLNCWIQLPIVIAAYVALFCVMEYRYRVVKNQFETQKASFDLQRALSRDVQAKLIEARSRYDESQDFKQRFLNKHAECLNLKEQLMKEANIIKWMAIRYKVPNRELNDRQRCVCPSNSDCWKNQACSYPACPVCTRKQ